MSSDADSSSAEPVPPPAAAIPPAAAAAATTAGTAAGVGVGLGVGVAETVVTNLVADASDGAAVPIGAPGAVRANPTAGAGVRRAATLPVGRTAANGGGVTVGCPGTRGSDAPQRLGQAVLERGDSLAGLLEPAPQSRCLTSLGEVQQHQQGHPDDRREPDVGADIVDERMDREGEGDDHQRALERCESRARRGLPSQGWHRAQAAA